MTDGQALDDSALTDAGLAATGSGRVLVIACGALAREILALTRGHGWDHITLTCLPAILHNHPDRIATAVEAAVEENKGKFSTIFVAYADCGTGGLLQATCDRLGVRMIAGPHCYSFFEGNEAFAARSEEEFTSFYLTDFLARQFDAFVWEPLGLNWHPDLRDSYFGHYEKLVYLSQTDDPLLEAKAQDAAQRLGLRYERRHTGYGDLTAALASLGDAP